MPGEFLVAHIDWRENKVNNSWRRFKNTSDGRIWWASGDGTNKFFYEPEAPKGEWVKRLWV